MSCGCGQRGEKRPDVPETIAPDEPCIYCAYKHFHTARRLAAEPFYTAKNRGDIEGELVLSQWHLWKLTHLDLCRDLRNIRHKVESFQEQEIDWSPAILTFDSLLALENAKRPPEPGDPSANASR